MQVFRGSANALDLVAQFQGRQVHHHRQSDARAEVGGTGGQVSPSRRKRIIDFRLQRLVHGVDPLDEIVQPQAGCDQLHPQMIFLVDHDAEGFVVGYGDGAGDVGLGQVARDEVSFHKQLAVASRGLSQINPDHLLRQVAFENDLPCQVDQLPPLSIAGPHYERESGNIAGQANPAAHDHVGFRTVVAQPRTL